MDKTNRVGIVGRHLAFWAVYILYIAVDEGGRHRDSWRFELSVSDLSDLVISAILVYVNLYLLLPAFYKNQKYAQYVIALVALVFLGGLTDRFFSWLVWLPRERMLDVDSREPTRFWIPVRIVKNSLSNLPILSITLVLKLMRDSNQREKRLREMEKEKFQAEMNLLKAQINPHFFFNTLNSLYSLTLPISGKASDVILRLSGIMRYMLYDTSAAKVPLIDEIKHLENYIAIEHMRFTDRLELSFQYSGEMAGKMVTPLLLLPFIENAFKHGIGDGSGWVTIDLKVIGNRLFLKVENSCTPIVAAKSGGLGLRNVKRRLELVYPNNHRLQIEQAQELFAVELKINL